MTLNSLVALVDPCIDFLAQKSLSIGSIARVAVAPTFFP